MARKQPKHAEPDGPIDLASRIGGAPAARPEPAAPAAPAPVRRVDGPLESERPSRRGEQLIGANEAPMVIGANEAPARSIPPAPPERGASTGRPTMIGLEEAFSVPVAVPEPAPEPTSDSAPLPATPREAPAQGEMDLVVTPLATPDDWHHFELALRKVKGVGSLRTEYYRAGILKLRVTWSGSERFARALSDVPGYRVGILGEDRTTVQIRVARAGALDPR